MPGNAFPRILVGCPTYYLKEDSLEKYMDGLNRYTYPNFDVIIEDNSPTPEYSEKINVLGKKWEAAHPEHSFRVIYSGQTSPKARERLVNGRNKIREIALKENYDYFLSLEQDVVLPDNGIEQLLAHKKEIMSGTYFTYRETAPKQYALVVVAGKYASPADAQNEIISMLNIFDLLPSRTMELHLVGLGCVLIHRPVLEKVTFRYDPLQAACDDIYFCDDANKQGIKVYLDSGILCAHYFNDAMKKAGF